MSPPISIMSESGPYQVSFGDSRISALAEELQAPVHVLIDEKVQGLHEDFLKPVTDGGSCVPIRAEERSKSLEALPKVVEELTRQGIRRNHVLVAIGGGIIQDITAFLASCLLRGLDWVFIPTTLLAQADSCIGSKSSINCGSVKNLLGTFRPPRTIAVAPRFLSTLSNIELMSGLGEIIKVCAIDGPETFNEIKSKYPEVLRDHEVLQEFIFRALLIKKRFIERDEFDRGIRNIFNYGHSFGHAIEAATEFRIPHGVAVSIGMDMANFVAMEKKLCSPAFYEGMHSTLRQNYEPFFGETIDFKRFNEAISRDKKNEERGQLTLILPDTGGNILKMKIANNNEFVKSCQSFLDRDFFCQAS